MPGRLLSSANGNNERREIANQNFLMEDFSDVSTYYYERPKNAMRMTRGW
jgi:hypothetical protein